MFAVDHSVKLSMSESLLYLLLSCIFGHRVNKLYGYLLITTLWFKKVHLLGFHNKLYISVSQMLTYLTYLVA